MNNMKIMKGWMKEGRKEGMTMEYIDQAIYIDRVTCVNIFDIQFFFHGYYKITKDRLLFRLILIAISIVMDSLSISQLTTSTPMK